MGVRLPEDPEEIEESVTEEQAEFMERAMKEAQERKKQEFLSRGQR